MHWHLTWVRRSHSYCTDYPVTMHLDHENPYVRTGVAAALAEAVEQSPQSTPGTIKTLCELYREKVG